MLLFNQRVAERAVVDMKGACTVSQLWWLRWTMGRSIHWQMCHHGYGGTIMYVIMEPQLYFVRHSLASAEVKESIDRALIPLSTTSLSIC